MDTNPDVNRAAARWLARYIALTRRVPFDCRAGGSATGRRYGTPPFSSRSVTLRSE